ncbi:MAG: hypothetical protein OEW82_06710 [Dehalococcoidia bacterium]|nr:hypothetical protein [Dehalococcoidia bacterium]
MCKVRNKKGCEHPEKLKGKPEECSPEQIRECHGEVTEHPCVGKSSLLANWGKRSDRK